MMLSPRTPVVSDRGIGPEQSRKVPAPFPLPRGALNPIPEGGTLVAEDAVMDREEKARS